MAIDNNESAQNAHLVSLLSFSGTKNVTTYDSDDSYYKQTIKPPMKMSINLLLTQAIYEKLTCILYYTCINYSNKPIHCFNP